MSNALKIKQASTPIYLFDGHCVLCSRAVAYVLRHEKSPDMRFVAILSEEGRILAEANDIEPDEPESFLIIKDGKIFKSSDAVIVLAQYIGGLHKLAKAGNILPRPFRDWLYGFIARNRYKIFGRSEQCYVPSPENRARFVLT
ncbi:MAG: DCC1-like thiol-disulfide oxidoreductase family protein [Hellea sp.]